MRTMTAAAGPKPTQTSGSIVLPASSPPAPAVVASNAAQTPVAPAAVQGMPLQACKTTGNNIESVTVSGSGNSAVVEIQVGGGGQSLAGPFLLRLMVRDDEAAPWRVVHQWSDVSGLAPGSSVRRVHQASLDPATATSFLAGRNLKATLSDLSGKPLAALQGTIP